MPGDGHGVAYCPGEASTVLHRLPRQLAGQLPGLRLRLPSPPRSFTAPLCDPVILLALQ